jgi:hypothetical protein
MGGVFTTLFLLICVLTDGFGRLYGFDLLYNWAEDYTNIKMNGGNMH